MLKNILKTASLLIALSVSANSFAAIITDTVTQTVKINMLGSYDYTHDINDDGFVLGTALSGNLAIDVWDDRRGLNEIFPEVVLFTIEAFDFDTGAITFGDFNGDLEFSALAALNANGLLDVTVTSLSGDFYLGNSVLTVTTADSAVSVSEPATLALFGLGLMGLGFSRKKLSA